MATKKREESGAANADAAELLKQWGIPVDPELLIVALTHRSFANEVGTLPNNERLEFLGDSVLGLIATDELYHRFPDEPESRLARIRSLVVSQQPLAEVARSIGLGEFILLGVGENRTGGRNKPSILSDTLEALIGATYLTNGLEPTRKVLLEHLRPIIDAADKPDVKSDWKSPLAQHLRAAGRPQVTFEVEGSGPDHNRYYTATAVLEDQPIATGEGPSKKAAENDAARVALEVLTAGNSA